MQRRAHVPVRAMGAATEVPTQNQKRGRGGARAGAGRKAGSKKKKNTGNGWETAVRGTSKTVSRSNESIHGARASKRLRQAKKKAEKKAEKKAAKPRRKRKERPSEQRASIPLASEARITRPRPGTAARPEPATPAIGGVSEQPVAPCTAAVEPPHFLPPGDDANARLEAQRARRELMKLAYQTLIATQEAALLNDPAALLTIAFGHRGSQSVVHTVLAGLTGEYVPSAAEPVAPTGHLATLTQGGGGRQARCGKSGAARYSSSARACHVCMCARPHAAAWPTHARARSCARGGAPLPGARGLS